MNLLQFYEKLTNEERIIVDVLREFVLSELKGVTEKFSYGVPYYYGNRRICLIWPASIPRGGIKSGVLFGFCYGSLLRDEDAYLHKGTNKQVFYRIYNRAEEIDFEKLAKLLAEARSVDAKFKIRS